MTEMKENTIGKDRILRPILKVGDEVQVREYEYSESEYRGCMEIISVYDTEHGKVYMVDDDGERDVCREEDALGDDGFLSGLVIDSCYL